MAKRRTPRGAILWSWIVAAVVWLWIINDLVVRDLPPTGTLANAGAELLFEGLFFVVVATALAAFAMFLVRLIGRVAAWLKLRFVEGK